MKIHVKRGRRVARSAPDGTGRLDGPSTTGPTATWPSEAGGPAGRKNTGRSDANVSEAKRFAVVKQTQHNQVLYREDYITGRPPGDRSLYGGGKPFSSRSLLERPGPVIGCQRTVRLERSCQSGTLGGQMGQAGLERAAGVCPSESGGHDHAYHLITVGSIDHLNYREITKTNLCTSKPDRAR